MFSNPVIKFLTDILNEGLRPHLTTYQAKFRKWYDVQIKLESNKLKSPQEIQRQYHDYKNLIDSIIEVNEVLISYAKQLRKIINGKFK